MVTKYIIGEFFSSSGATFYKNLSDQTVAHASYLYQDSSINPGLELLMTIFAASPDDICDELRLDNEALTGLWWCWLGLRADAVDGGGAEPKGGGTTKLDDEFIRKVLSQVAELYEELVFPLWLGETWWGPGGDRVIWNIRKIFFWKL